MADIDFTGQGISIAPTFGTPKIITKVYPTGIASTLSLGTPRGAPTSALLSAPGEPTSAALTTASGTPQTAALVTSSGPATAS
jgi:hypothetical protein